MDDDLEMSVVFICVLVDTFLMKYWFVSGNANLYLSWWVVPPSVQPNRTRHVSGMAQ